MPRRFFFQVALVVFVLTTLAVGQRPDGLLHIWFLATAGDAILIQTPSGQYILVDGGSDPVALAGALGRVLPFWKHSLDAVILTLPDSQHAPGQVAALARYHANTAFSPPIKATSATMREWARLVNQARTPLRRLQSGMHFRIDNVEFEVLAAGGESGVVLSLQYGANRVMLAQGISAAAETTLAATSALRRVDLIAYPWERDPNNHFVETLTPRAIVFTDGLSEDQPAELTMPERAVGGAALYHKRLHGTIEWRSDGRRATIAVEQNYCASSSTWSERLWTSFHKVSASCSKRERS